MGNQMMKAQLRAGKTPGLKEMIAQGYQAQGLERTDSSGPIRLKVYKEWLALSQETQGLKRDGYLKAKDKRVAQGYEVQGLEETNKEDQLESGQEVNGLKTVYSKC